MNTIDGVDREEKVVPEGQVDGEMSAQERLTDFDLLPSICPLLLRVDQVKRDLDARLAELVKSLDEMPL